MTPLSIVVSAIAVLLVCGWFAAGEDTYGGGR